MREESLHCPHCLTVSSPRHLDPFELFYNGEEHGYNYTNIM